jgi:predicted RND superfamily exporter protein
MAEWLQTRQTSMSFFETRYMQWHEALDRRAVLTITLLVTALILSTIGMRQLHLDMSFRPLFASGSDIADATEEFERVFGQASGAWIVAILENSGNSTAEFVRTTARLSETASHISHVTEVLSITALRVPHWSRGSLSFAAPIPPYLLEPGEEEELQYQYEDLLDGTRFVNWLISADGSRLLLAARLDLPLDDLAGRRAVVEEFTALLGAGVPENINIYFTGVSVVELAYEQQVLRDQITATVLTTIVLVLLLYWSFGSVRSVLVCLTPVMLAIPATLGIMGWLGLPLIIINTAIPAIVLVIGIADAVHMLTSWLEARENGEDLPGAAQSMLRATGKACFFTTVTTIGGFLALQSAKLDSIVSFGQSVAIGIFIAWLSNQTLLPWILRRTNAGNGLPAGRVNRIADDAISTSMHYATERPGRVLTVCLLCTAACGAVTPFVDVDQKFNEELPDNHPIIRSQLLLEKDFGGFLGPEISIRKTDGESMLDDDSVDQLRSFVRAVRELPETRHVWSILDVLPRGVSIDERVEALAAMRSEPIMSQQLRELISAGNDHLAVIVRIGDIGTSSAGKYHESLNRLAADNWNDRYEVEIVGQWWLAQYGMRLVLRDMLVSLATAMLFVLPLMWFALRESRLFVAATLANLLPLVLPLALMAVTGITLRIGTAVVLAIALGIVVDNTLHIIIRLRATAAGGGGPVGQISRAMRGTGRAVIFTTLALVGGFLSMLTNQLLAIRDMGLVAAVTILGAMLADLLFLPAVYINLTGRRVSRQEADRLSVESSD